LALRLHICQLNRQSAHGALRLVVCVQQRRLFVRHPCVTNVEEEAM
jgi:hypothetical protein